ncbi:hypothetical protein [Streptomyces sp. NBC_00996]|nr:hypothetical protein OG390_04775 [Streptomyces sp. NBC_00996]
MTGAGVSSARWAGSEQSAPWAVSSWGTDYTYTNLSDHYPLSAYAG